MSLYSNSNYALRRSILVALMLLVVSNFVAVQTAQPVAASNKYCDVSEDEYYAKAVEWSVAESITGIDGNCFYPETRATRGQTAVWMWRMSGSPTGFTHIFNDVPEPTQSSAVGWMYYNGITQGTSKYTFSPAGGLTRGEFAAFLWRLEGEPAAVQHSFDDVVADWQQAPVSWLAASGITKGTSPSMFSPGDTLIRSQLITFLCGYDRQCTNSTTTTTTTTTTTVPKKTITVPPEYPSGRCVSEIPKGVYEWEGCAWNDYRDNPEFNKEVTVIDAKNLMHRIWAEVYVEQKVECCLSVELDPDSKVCGMNATGCAVYDSHNYLHIILIKNRLTVLLHETAHLLLVEHKSILDCEQDATPENEKKIRRVCRHGDIFRCVADYLYVEYAGIPSADVCGTTTTDAASDER
ncbi:MAG: S-layer homology domain-containing protein [Acidimicrobiia bacterium]|nr:S-layer homology domain-containing protein [Acidimicrobiia bacterium]